MARSRARGTFLLSLLLVACGSGEKSDAAQTVVQLDRPRLDTTTPASGADSVAPPAPEDTALSALLAAGEQFGTTEREIRRILGAPDSVNATPFQNLHDSTQTDTILRFYYRDLILGLYRVTQARSDFLLQVILSGAGRRLPFGIGVGTNREQLVAIVGPGKEGLDDSSVETLEYGGPTDDSSMIRFYLRKDRVQRVEWTYFID